MGFNALYQLKLNNLFIRVNVHRFLFSNTAAINNHNLVLALRTYATGWRKVSKNMLQITGTNTTKLYK